MIARLFGRCEIVVPVFENPIQISRRIIPHPFLIIRRSRHKNTTRVFGFRTTERGMHHDGTGPR
jgi:hypothetical protein